MSRKQALMEMRTIILLTKEVRLVKEMLVKNNPQDTNIGGKEIVDEPSPITCCSKSRHVPNIFNSAS